MLLVWMSRVVTFLLAMVVVLSRPAIPTTVTLTDNELCHQLQDGKLQVLAMGEARDSPGYPHSLWILVEGGYLIALPTTNLQIDFREKRASLTIDQNVFEADERFNLHYSDFTHKPSDSNAYRFFLITNQKHYGLLGWMTRYENKSVVLQTFYLGGGTANSRSKFNADGTIAFIASSWPEEGSTNAFGYQLAFNFDTLGFGVKWTFTVQMKTDTTVELRSGPYSHEHASHLTFSSKVNLITGFFIKLNSVPYFIVIDDNLMITIAKVVQDSGSTGVEYKDKFQVHLSDLIKCNYVFPERPQDLTRPSESRETTKKKMIMWYSKNRPTTESNGDDTENWVVGVALMLVVGITLAICLWKNCATDEKKKKNKNSSAINSKIGSSVISSGVTESNASSAQSSCPVSTIDSNCVPTTLKTAKSVDKPNKTTHKKKNSKLKVSSGSRIHSTQNDNSQLVDSEANKVEFDDDKTKLVEPDDDGIMDFEQTNQAKNELFLTQL